ncbi:MAG: cyclase family protein [Bacteroidetes bacterium]|nr:cyclase family protein [Bacteroidota bacterium]
MEDFIDITYTVSNELPVWPGSRHFKDTWQMQMPAQSNNLSYFEMDSHLGTHLDAPLHFVHGGRPLHKIDLCKMIGDTYVAEIRGVRSITSEHLSNLILPKGCKRLLLKTDNQIYWENNIATFQEDFCSIDKSGAQWLVDHSFDLIGIDYLSIQRFHDGPETHQILLRAEVVIVETLNLQNVSEGLYELICLPLKIKDLEASPVRAILKNKI